MHEDPLDVPARGSRSLPALLEAVQSARQGVREARGLPLGRENLSTAHASLLKAMEHYTAHLTACGLPIPPSLRDDLRLERNLNGQ